MEQHRNLQHQPLPLPQSVEFLHVVKDTQGILFQHLVMAGVALIALRNVPGRSQYIVLKVVAEFHKLVLAGIFCGNAVTEADAGHPEHLGPGQLQNPFVYHHTWQEQGRILAVDSESLLDLIRCHLAHALVETVHRGRVNLIPVGIQVQPVDNIKNVLTDANEVCDFPVLQIHLPEGKQFIVHNLLYMLLVFFHSGRYPGQQPPYAKGAQRQILSGHQRILVK